MGAGVVIFCVFFRLGVSGKGRMETECFDFVFVFLFLFFLGWHIKKEEEWRWSVYLLRFCVILCFFVQ